MPELPEVEALAGFLRDRCRGETVERAEVAALSALKTFSPPIEALVGGEVGDVGRVGKYLDVPVGSLHLVLHLARGGWIRWSDMVPATRARPGRGPLALRVGLSSGSGFDVTEQGTEKRLAIWVVASVVEVDGIARLGPDPLGAGFSAGRLGEILASRPAHLKTVLTDQSAIAGVGNAYSDEALHAARLSPYKTASKLTGEEVGRLHAALVSVLSAAVERSAGLPASGLKGEKKEGLAVHGRAGQLCPVCGDTIREVSLSSKSFQYCPTCQTGGKPLADRRLSRLLR